MKASELRIGNLVWNDTQKIVVPVDLKILSEQFYREPAVKSGTLDKDCLWTPIPLTEEWLRKFGFKEQDGYFYQPNSHGDFELHPSNDGKTFGIAIDGYVDVRLSKFIDLINVHELQNFWFAVTGEELTSK